MGKSGDDDVETRDERVGRLSATQPAGMAGKTPPVRASGRIDARYTIGKEIARGGMGRVVEATDGVLGREVALKEALSGDADALQRFARETLITARLEHPSIVPVYDAGVTPDGSPFYVMRKVSGEPLEELVRLSKTLNERLALLPHVLATAQAVAHAHERRVIHRDLKPANILVGALGETVVIDWGLAKVLDDTTDEVPSRPSRPSSNALTRMGAVFGTPGFMSPEQLRGDPVDARVDVYALGATLYYVLAQRPPHSKRTGDEMMLAALEGPPAPLTSLIEDVPAELVTIVDRALSYDRSARYADASGFAEDLRRYLTGQLVASHRYTQWERVIRFVRRHRMSVAIAAVAVVAIAIGSAVAFNRLVAERDRTRAALGDALERNEELALAHARSLLATNPTAALARIRPLATKYWKAARSLAAAARAAGVARGMRASSTTAALELAGDGTHAMSVGGDGVVRTHELTTGTSQVIAELGISMHARYADGDRVIVAWGGRQIVVIDIATKRRVDIASAGPVTSLDTAGRTLWWTVEIGTVWTTGFDEVTPRELVVDDRVDRIALAGANVALGGREHLWIAQNGAPPVAVATGAVWSIAWAPHGNALAALVGTETVEVQVGTVLSVSARYPAEGARVLAWQDGAITGARGMITRKGQPQRFSQGLVLSVAPLRGDALLVTTDFNQIAIVDEHSVFNLPPTHHIGVVAGRPESKFALAGAHGAILIWDLDAVLPHEMVLPPGSEPYLMLANQVLSVDATGAGTWIDTRTNTRTQFTSPSPHGPGTLSPEGGVAAITDHNDQLFVLRRGEPIARSLEIKQGWMCFVSERYLAVSTVASPSTQLRLYNLDDLSFVVLADNLPAIVELQARDARWLSVQFEDGAILRHDLTNRATARLPPRTVTVHRLLPGGDVMLADREHVWRWDVKNALVSVATTPAPISLLSRAGAEHVLAFTGDDGGSLISLTDGHLTEALPPGTRYFDFSLDSELGTFVDAAGALFLIDPLTSTSWRIGTPAVGRYGPPMLAEDHSSLVVKSGDRLLVWTLEFPATREETLALIDRLTNARATQGSAGLEWE